MRKRMTDYMKQMDEVLSAEKAQTDYEKLRAEHLIQIQFFQHERLIHLIVTCLFAVMAIAVFLTLMFVFSIGLLLLFGALMILLIPYIRHYYFLENGVQRMYEQYDRLRER